MKLEKIVLEDVGVYSGRNEIDLSSTDDDPVVLFGGKNGAGKTTLFNSIKLGLHGKSALGSRVSRSEYEDEIRALLHEGPKKSADAASICLFFEHDRLGQREEYMVCRSWRDRGQSIVEDLEIRRDGEPLSDLDSEQWDDFLKELIPPWVLRMFFFDGEEIQDLARSIEDKNEFREILNSLLGLETAERLDADLSIYISKLVDQSDHEEYKEELESLQGRRELLLNGIDHFEDEKAQINDRLDELAKEIGKKERDLTKAGGTFAEKRDSLKEKKAKLENEIETRKQSVRNIAEGLLPFSYAPDLARNVQDRLEEESKRQKRMAAAQLFEEKLDGLTLSQLGEEDQGLDLSENQFSHVIDLIRRRLSMGMLDEGECSEETTLLHQFSEAERKKIDRWIDQALKETPQKLAKECRKLESAMGEIRETQKGLSRVPDEMTISPIVEELNELSEERGALQKRLSEVEDELRSIEHELAKVEKDIERTEKKISNKEDISEKAQLASDVKAFMDVFLPTLIDEKLERLEKLMSEHYVSLSRKQEYFTGVTIDPETLDVRILTKGGGSIPQTKLSKGERQIFAMSLLWSLAESSGRELPFVMDSPLGRLDTEHKVTVVEKFFQKVSHQVVLFSTDDEIDRAAFNLIQPALSKSYHLSYDQENGITSIEPGYFWDTEEELSRIEVTG